MCRFMLQLRGPFTQRWWPVSIMLFDVAFALRPRRLLIYFTQRWWRVSMALFDVALAPRPRRLLICFTQRWWPVSIMLFDVAFALRPRRLLIYFTQWWWPVSMMLQIDVAFALRPRRLLVILLYTTVVTRVHGAVWCCTGSGTAACRRASTWRRLDWARRSSRWAAPASPSSAASGTPHRCRAVRDTGSHLHTGQRNLSEVKKTGGEMH